ncbi:MAG: SGNH/GDSL hydrolase family protein [Labedaea sp.]
MNQSLRFRVLGDSLAVGVGCQRPEQTPGHLLAAALRAAGHHVDLRVHAVPRARSTDLAAQVRAALVTGVDLALIIIGANDLTALLPPDHGARLLHDAVSDLRAAGAEIVVVTAPDLSVVSHVPPALRALVSQASRAYARTQADAALRAGATVATIDPALLARFTTGTDLFSPDRFHPSAAGYALIARALTPYLQAAADKHAA